ncbi:hypothetical protein BJ170DRAFT_608967 [Xylariales sp. AK1849]|nr:hypothetical protein BJ170DRAFT_608967 [Xylariales sp. AK1849]
MPGSQSNAHFVSGDLEGPFCDKVVASSSAMNGPNTPLKTPSMKEDGFFADGLPTIGLNNTHICRPKQRATSSAEWPVEGIINNNSQHWPSGSYVPDGCNLPSPDWWDEMANNPIPMQNGTSMNHAIHNQQFELPYEYTSEELSGLMIHMPQPRQPQAAVLRANIPEQFLTPTHSHPHASYGHRGHYTERRPMPRAPSSGARRHGSMTSPRKPFLHHSSSRPLLHHREDSASPSPTTLRRRSSSSISVRKQRSWLRESRTPHSSYSPSSVIGLASPMEGSGGSGIKFKHYTANNKDELMSGVAQSGSSKTKARQKKAEEERIRRLSEAAVKAVQAAGGDVEKLVREGLDIR